jgi:hypothetical protein
MSDDSKQVSCEIHGKATTTFVCSHLASHPVQSWHSAFPSDDNPWPDAWCDECNIVFLREGEWNDKNADGVDLKILCHFCYERAQGSSVGRLDGSRLTAWQSFVESCHQDLVAKQDKLSSEYSLSHHRRWDWDQERAELAFSNDGVPTVIANVEFIGSVSTKSNTWLWSWANPSLLKTVRSDITAVRDFGGDRDFPHLTVPKWRADETDGWDMASVAVHVLNAQGIYRTPGDNGFTFLALSNVRFAQ